ncbi:hypothetical protein KXD93_06365 [Mucilaginibacter sp. BJC16-A38]|uniref:hypothetical protein n=1 Tax=Mucilaginibacter phenanthrenivorans TaxID=1234842 RepID=UPI002157427B|nr:hypothetical protein [Mucilaginibacter phenanthrenivorans]MCR8557255.1 hypothetical protein [Mucilaginibacter phenanthrenivorans]
MKKIFLIAFSLILLAVVFACIYFVTGVSYEYPSVKKYEYWGKKNELISAFEKYAQNNRDVVFKIVDTVGNPENGYLIRLNIMLIAETRNIEYSLQFKKDANIAPSKIIIELTGAYDKTNNIGGYIKNAKGVDSLVTTFEHNFLTPIRVQQGIDIHSR